MSRKNFISGSVLEFKMLLNLGYAYCKILDFRDIREFDGVIAKVYDCIVKEPLKDINILNNKDYLFGARRMHALPNTRGRGAWKMKGVLIAADDNIIPDFKYSYQSSPFVENESTIKEWFVVKNIRESNDAPCTYEQVKHLEDTVVNTQIGIEIRTAMEYCRSHNMEIKKYFDLEDMANWNCYRAMINVPIYSTIPKNLRGKALY